MDVFLSEVDDALILFDAQKLNVSVANSMLKSVEYDTENGIWTFKQLDGTEYVFDQNIEKIPVSFSLTEDGSLIMTTEDGTEYTANIADLIKEYEFDDSDTIATSRTYNQDDGAYHVQMTVKKGSITRDHLDEDYFPDVQALANQAKAAADDSLLYSKDSKRWAVGDAEYPGSDKDNSKYYKELAEAAKTAAEQARDEAQAVADIKVMAPDVLGIGKPDDDTIGVDSSGTIRLIADAEKIAAKDTNEIVLYEKSGNGQVTIDNSSGSNFYALAVYGTSESASASTIILTVKENGSQNEQTVTIESVASLRGQIVDNGGNYVDTQGRSWLCDSIELIGGKYQYIKRMGDSSPLSEYEYTDLTDEEDSAIKELHVYKTQTVLENSIEADMTVLYTKDTQETDIQSLIDSLIKRFFDQLEINSSSLDLIQSMVTKEALERELQNYILKSDISAQNVNDETKIPAASVVYGVSQDVESVESALETTKTDVSQLQSDVTNLETSYDALIPVSIISGFSIATSEWKSNQYTISNSAIKSADTICDVYVANASLEVFEKAKITGVCSAGKLTLTCEKVPTAAIQIDCIKVVG